MGTRIAAVAGEKVNRLTAIRPVAVGGKGAKWLFRCDCGVEKEIYAKDVRGGHTKSCGCLNREKQCRGTTDLQSSANRAYRSYRGAAKFRDFEWQLSEVQFMEITQAECIYCGAKPANRAPATRGSGVHYLYNGIDRLDNSKGYYPDNVVPCCWKCNRMKQTLSVEEFIEHCKLVAARSIEVESFFKRKVNYGSCRER